jgi:hypothetical protein
LFVAVVSVPEKTLEHWASLYIASRYSTAAALWWPSHGEDIDVHVLPGRPGKAVQIELKTTTVHGPRHLVKVDLGQLWDYTRRPRGRQPFYVFPLPRTAGTLTAAAQSHGLAVTEFAYRRSGQRWWFAEWMVALTTEQVARVLATELARHGRRDRGPTATLVTVDLTLEKRPTLTWGTGAAAPPFVTWRDLWTRIERCGEPGWPQLLRLPREIVAGREILSAPEATMLLLIAADLADGERRAGSMATFESNPDGGFQLEREDDVALPNVLVDPADEPDHRQLVFLDATMVRPPRHPQQPEDS